MVDITNKNTTLRTAVAQAVVKVSKPETIAAIKTILFQRETYSL